MNTCIQGFNGLRPDPVSGDYHPGNGYRTFRPSLMRFASPDDWSPFGAGGINPYAYCGGDPVNHADPSGHMSLQTGLSIALSLAGIAAALFTGGMSLAAAGTFSAALTTASAVSLTAGASALVADVTGLASSVLQDFAPRPAAILTWTSLAAGVLSLGIGLAAGGYRALERATADLRARLVRVNGRIGIPMSGEFRNALFLGGNHGINRLSWNFRFEDTVPRGQRLTIVMTSALEGNVTRPGTEFNINENWVPHTFTPVQFRALVVAEHEEFDVYRLVIPNSARRYNSGQRTIAGDFRYALNTESPVVGYRSIPQGQGPVANELEHAFTVFHQLERQGFTWEAQSAQNILDGLSQTYGATEGALTFQGEHRVYPSYFRMAALEPNWQ